VVKDRRRIIFGAEAEAGAEAHLIAAGLSLSARNWRGAGRLEVDLIMRDGDIPVIVEVRAQNATGKGFAGHPAYTIGPTKQRRVQLAGMAWLRQQQRSTRTPDDWLPTAVRFDVVTLVRQADRTWDLHWFRRAF